MRRLVPFKTGHNVAALGLGMNASISADFYQRPVSLSDSIESRILAFL
jgi:hypothetical protein